jgi:hypothetical protein
MINIHGNFIGGNICVKEILEDTVLLENEIRDTQGDWFYWAFCVEGAQGRTLTFKMQQTRIGYWGPAVSHDLAEWSWLDSCAENSFTYSFGKDESRVYFAHHMLYHPERFHSLCQSLNLRAKELCKSRKGRSVPCLHMGKGEKSIIFTARHHACESTGSYVLEGVIKELVQSPIEEAEILIVPFVDYDGVVDGDQGKARIPHDHNRDYIESPIYPEVRSICKHMDAKGCHYGFDLHSPWHKGGVNDKIFIVRNLVEKEGEFDAFSSIFESEISGKSMKYFQKDDYPPCTNWNQPSTSFGYIVNNRQECNLAFTLESTYFGEESNKVCAEKLVELGKCFAKAVKKYVKLTSK